MSKINLNDFNKRKLDTFYLVLYAVTKQIKIRTDSCITDRTVYVLFGINVLGNRKILGIYFDNKYDNRFWLEKFEDIKARKVDNILFLVTPHNKSLERCVKIVYNDIKIVQSPDEISSAINKFFSDKTSRKMRISFKNLFLAEDKERYTKELELFKQIYVDNKIIMLLLESKQDVIEKFYQYDYPLRKLLYPYYAIREMKKQLNKLQTKENLCTNINEVIEALLEYINSFESGRTYYKKDWLEVISSIYEDYKEVGGIYI